MSENIRLFIKEKELNEFAMHVLTVSDELNSIFSDITSKMDELKAYYNGNNYDSLISSYNDFKGNYLRVKDGVVSYSDDLIALIDKVRSGDEMIAFTINQIAEDAKKQAEEIVKK